MFIRWDRKMIIKAIQLTALLSLAGTMILGTPDGDIVRDERQSSDLVYTIQGNDLAVYTPSENIKQKDIFDGGEGFDILRLRLGQNEYDSTEFQTDLVRSQYFMLNNMNPFSAGGDGPAFKFKAFDLEMRNFEVLDIEVINTVPEHDVGNKSMTPDIQPIRIEFDSLALVEIRH